MKPITLVMTTPKGEHAEYNLFCCSRLPKTYLMDLYALYEGIENQEQTVAEHVQSVTTLRVDKIVDPSLWINCILWSRYRRQGENASLELFVGRLKHSQMYYAVGTSGTLLMSPSTTIKVHTSTIQMLCGESKTNCSNPKIYWVDRKENCITK